MSFATLESAVLYELRTVTGKTTLRKKDIQEWSTGEVKTVDGELVFFLPDLKVNCAVKREALGKNWKPR